MMSQNRAAERDPQNAATDYRVNVRAEHEARRLHLKPDTLRDAQWAELVQMQHEQITLLTQLVAQDQTDRSSDGRRAPSGDARPSNEEQVAHAPARVEEPLGRGGRLAAAHHALAEARPLVRLLDPAVAAPRRANPQVLDPGQLGKPDQGRRVAAYRVGRDRPCPARGDEGCGSLRSPRAVRHLGPAVPAGGVPGPASRRRDRPPRRLTPWFVAGLCNGRDRGGDRSHCASLPRVGPQFRDVPGRPHRLPDRGTTPRSARGRQPRCRQGGRTGRRARPVPVPE